ncbi:MULTISPECIES: hypothetical protein [unclassified Pantoea]|uniref:hypothetical protein n=1 Tax=unclassified Pantoea TaxID=2630326 RepID=UPI001232906F|nr:MULTISPECIES: hypothetical protein [unclassified Pantoea]KAA5969513.1 hypothetical protein F3I51_16640 [Pantoea sp. M_6]KAA5975732.1 hypothetical protein F3I52_14770 [Pantoea sp. M_8]KAA5993949.1 hypothetical protein F3I47_02775 [Pantoea sp. M_10]KAA5998937.1 hypothetical protein F3I50_08465 [Pantoea sp. M_5]
MLYFEHRQPSSVVITLFLCQSTHIGSEKKQQKKVKIISPGNQCNFLHQSAGGKEKNFSEKSVLKINCFHKQGVIKRAADGISLAE